MCDGPDCPPPLPRLFDWLAPFLDAAAAEQAKRAKAAKRKIARALRVAERAFDARAKHRRSMYTTMWKTPYGDRSPAWTQELYKREAEIDEASLKRLNQRVDLIGLLEHLRDAYGIVLPPGYSVEWDVGTNGITIHGTSGGGGFVGGTEFDQPALAALRFAAMVEVRTPRRDAGYHDSGIGDRLLRVEMADYMVKNAERFGLTKGVVKELEAERLDAHGALPDEYIERVAGGNYHPIDGPSSRPDEE